ncbi:MAG: carboxypeptidase regulatory-like domain-containing protein [Planctomycetes bacterium]|nr:carboxypeptidase regulatory-like domain-containing protein [Planctomycetota bacterium]
MAKKITLTVAAALLLTGIPWTAHTWWSGSFSRVSSPQGLAPAALKVAATGPQPPDKEPDPAAAPIKPAPETKVAFRTALRGLVWDDEDQLVAGAKVSLTPRIESEEKIETGGDLEAEEEPHGPRFEAISNERGEYSFQGLEPGKYRFRFEKEGYLPAGRYGVELKENEAVELNALLCHALRVFGCVRNGSGESIPGAEVRVDADSARNINDFDEENHDRIFPTDDQGCYDTGFRLILFGKFSFPMKVLARAPGYALKKVELLLHDFPLDKPKIEKELDFALEPEQPLLLRVLDPRGAPVSGAEVSGGNQLDKIPLTDSGGEVRFSNLSKERTAFQVAKEGFFTEDVRVEPERIPEVEVRLKPMSPPVEGEIAFPAALPEADRAIHQAFLQELDENGRLSRLHWCVRLDRKNFRYDTRPPQPGRYRVVCSCGLRDAASEPFDYSGRESLRADIRFALEPPYLAGKAVERESGEPAAGVEVILRWGPKHHDSFAPWGSSHGVNGFFFPNLPGISTSTRSDAGGNFLLLLPQGDRARGEESIRGFAAASASSDALGWSEIFDFDFNEKTVFDNLRLELVKSGGIEGAAVEADGQPAAGEIVAVYDGLDTLKWKAAGWEGRYFFDGLRPGSYLVLPLGRSSSGPLIQSRSSEGTDQIPPPREFFQFPVLVEPGKTIRRDMDLRTERLGQIEGEVPEALKEAATAECGLLVNGRTWPHTALAREENIRGRRFFFENLLPGRYRLWIGRAWERFSEIDLEVELGRTARAEMPVPEGSLSIPVPGLAADRAAGIEVRRVEKLEDYRERGEEVWTDWGGFRVSAGAGGARIDGLPAGVIRAQLIAPGFQAAWSQPALVSRNGEARAALLTAGGDLRISFEVSTRLQPPASPKFSVWMATEGPSVPFTLRHGGDPPAWILSGLPPAPLQLRIDLPPEFKEVELAVQIDPDRPTELKIPLQPARE